MSRRWGTLRARHDALIEKLIKDPLYDIRPDGTVWTLVCRSGKVSTNNSWRLSSSLHRRTHQNGSNYCSLRLKYRQRNLMIHRIIYAKFCGPLSPDLVVDHVDGNPLNNTPSNLELVTQAENISRCRGIAATTKLAA